MAHPGHRGEKFLQALGVGVERFEEPRAAAAQLVLRQAGAQALGEMGPERIEPVIRHLEDAADVGRFFPVEKEGGLGSVAVAVAFTLEKAERDERIEEIAGGAFVQAEPAAQALEFFGAAGELGEDLHLDRAQERFRGPEGEAGLQDFLGRGRGIHAASRPPRRVASIEMPVKSARRAAHPLMAMDRREAKGGERQRRNACDQIPRRRRFSGCAAELAPAEPEGGCEAGVGQHAQHAFGREG
ncbi:MAG TPA: hypothetical protein VG710_01420 [Opitutus sp.]|nr:hypothetical protein [Opitutus sp.]